MRLSRKQLRQMIRESISSQLISEAPVLIQPGKIPTREPTKASYSGENYAVPGGSTASYVGFLRYPDDDNSSGMYHLIEDEAGYEYALYLSNEIRSEYNAESGKKYSDIPAEKYALALTKSPKEGSKASRQNPTPIDPNEKPDAHKAIRSMFDMWAEKYDAAAAADDKKKADQQAADDLKKNLQKYGDGIKEAQAKGEELARKFFSPNASEDTSLVIQNPPAGYAKGMVWSKAKTVRIYQLIMKMKAECDAIASEDLKVDGKTVQTRPFPYAYNAFIDRTAKLFKGPPYNWENDWEPYEVFKWSRNNTKPSRGAKFKRANTAAKNAMRQMEKLKDELGWSKIEGKYSVTTHDSLKDIPRVINESKKEKTVKRFSETRLVSHYVVPANGEMIRNSNPGCKHYGSEGSVSGVEMLPGDAGHVVSYIVTNDGPTYSVGDTLTKTLDQLEMLPPKDEFINESLSDRELMRDWIRSIKKG